MDLSEFEARRRFQQAWEAVRIARPVHYTLFTFGESQLPYWLVCEGREASETVTITRGDVRITRPLIITPDNIGPEFRNFFESDDEGALAGFIMERTAAFSHLQFDNQHGPARIERRLLRLVLATPFSAQVLGDVKLFIRGQRIRAIECELCCAWAYSAIQLREIHLVRLLVVFEPLLAGGAMLKMLLPLFVESFFAEHISEQFFVVRSHQIRAIYHCLLLCLSTLSLAPQCIILPDRGLPCITRRSYGLLFTFRFLQQLLWSILHQPLRDSSPYVSS